MMRQPGHLPDEAIPWVGVGRSETGRVRPTNQDAFAVLNDDQVWIVADGMGGHPAGDLAATIAVETAKRLVSRGLAGNRQPSESAGQALGELLMTAHAAIREHSRTRPELTGMGTTVVAITIVLAPQPAAQVAHVGDSRAYLFRAGQLTQLTRDHTLIEEYLREGLIDRTAAKSHPQRHILTRALGLDEEITPDRSSIPLEADDVLLLCSDGLTKMLEDEDIASILRRADPSPHNACDALVEEALLRGGDDNVTVIVCARGSS
jgi:protein phosphatase